jgi:drug/metabolite transporter (DMT)-like permease
VSRRKQSRRRHREERKLRAPDEALPDPPRPRAQQAAARDISWLGVFGGLLGVTLLGQAAVFNLTSDDGTTAAAAALAAMACTYLPAIWASVVSTSYRQRVQRGVIAVTLAFVVLGVLFVDPAFATLLLIPSTLLAIAGGLVFQGRGRSR